MAGVSLISSNPCTPERWKRLSDELPDAEVKEMLTSFWMVSNFVGEAIE
jgi:hypothetical protein